MKTFLTSYCNKPHRLKDGFPIEHECRILPPKALRAEIAENFELAQEILSKAVTRYAKRGAKRDR